MTFFTFNRLVCLPALRRKLADQKASCCVFDNLHGWITTDQPHQTVYPYLKKEKFRETYKEILEKHPECVRGNLVYDKLADKNLSIELVQYECFRQLFKRMEKDAKTYTVNNGAKRTPFHQHWLNEGYYGENLGVISEDTKEKVVGKLFSWSPSVAENLITGTVMMPAWFAPQNLGALYMRTKNSTSIWNKLYEITPSHWIGTPNVSEGVHVVESLYDILLTGENAVTWSGSLLYWCEDYTLASDLSLPTLLKIYLDAAKHKHKPLTDLVAEKIKTTDTKKILGMVYTLPETDIQTLSNVFDDLLTEWRINARQTISVGNKVVQKVHDGYFLGQHGRDNRLADFTIDITAIDPDNKNYTGFVTYKNGQYPFSWDMAIFDNAQKLYGKVKALVVENGCMGIPSLSPDNRKYFLQAVLDLSVINN